MTHHQHDDHDDRDRDLAAPQPREKVGMGTGATADDAHRPERREDLPSEAGHGVAGGAPGRTSDATSTGRPLPDDLAEGHGPHDRDRNEPE